MRRAYLDVMRALLLGIFTAMPLFAAPRSPQAREHKLPGPHGTDFVYEPRETGPKPVAIFLHALCGASWHWSLTLEDAISPHAWLISPEANRKCAGGGASWGGGGAAVGALIDNVIERAKSVDGAGPADAPRVLMGFSQGAWIALDVVRAQPGKYNALVLMAMDVKTNARELRDAGIERIVLASGDRDGASGPMRALARRLQSEQFPARYASFGAVGHTIPLDGNVKLQRDIAWLYESRD